MVTKYNYRTPPKKIRERLDELCDPRKRLFDDPNKYRDLLFPEFSSYLEVVEPPPPINKQFNCYAYALGLREWVHRRVIVEAIKDKKLIITIQPKLGDIVIYLASQQEIKHAAKFIKDTKIVSKWDGGAVFKHDLFVVPLSYGEIVEFYKAITPKEASILLDEYRPLNYRAT